MFAEKEVSAGENFLSLFDLDKYEWIKKILNCNPSLEPRFFSALLWVLVQLGQITAPKKKKISEDEFINLGLASFLSGNQEQNKLDNMEQRYYRKIVQEIIDYRESKRYVFKDVSASIFQNAALFLNTINEDSNKILNLSNKNNDWEDVWYDPYIPFVEEIKKSIDPELEKFFNRKTLKKPIMTVFYNVSAPHAKDYFLDEVKKEFNITNEEVLSKLKNEFFSVFKKIKYLDEKILFTPGIRSIQLLLEKNSIFKIEFPDFSFNRLYFKMNYFRIDIKVLGERETVVCQNSIKSTHLDLRKTRDSCIANVFQGTDAFIAREVTRRCNFNVFSIHDAFGISIYNCDSFVREFNRIFNAGIKTNFNNDEPIKIKNKSKFILK